MSRSVRSLLRKWRYRPENHARDLRLDFLRGYCVVVMTVNHLGTFPAWTRPLTGAGSLWVSAAEGFVLVSGVVLGMLYRKRVKERGWHWSARKIGRRALQLYLLGVLGQIILSTGDYLLRFYQDRPSPLPMDYRSLLEAALYQAQYKFPGVDLLPLYAVLLPYGLLLVYLLTRGQWKWVAIISLFAWYAKHVDLGWFSLFHTGFPFNLWQLPFTIGVVAGYFTKQLPKWLARLPGRRSSWSAILVGSAAVLLFVNYQVTFHDWFPEIEWLKSSSPLFMRSPLALGRVVLSVWIFAGLYSMVSWIWGVLEPPIGWLLLPLGKNALTAYLVQALLFYIVTRMPDHPFPDHDPTIMGFLHVGAVLLVWSATKGITRLLGGKRSLKTTVMHLDLEKEGSP